MSPKTTQQLCNSNRLPDCPLSLQIFTWNGYDMLWQRNNQSCHAESNHSVGHTIQVRISVSVKMRWCMRWCFRTCLHGLHVKTKPQSSTTWCFHQQQEHQQFQKQPCAVEETRVRKNNLTISHSPTVSVRKSFDSTLSCKRRLCPKKPIEATNHAWWLAALHWNTRETCKKLNRNFLPNLETYLPPNCFDIQSVFVRISHLLMPHTFWTIQWFSGAWRLVATFRLCTCCLHGAIGLPDLHEIRLSRIHFNFPVILVFSNLNDLLLYIERLYSRAESGGLTVFSVTVTFLPLTIL